MYLKLGKMKWRILPIGWSQSIINHKLMVPGLFSDNKKQAGLLYSAAEFIPSPPHYFPSPLPRKSIVSTLRTSACTSQRTIPSDLNNHNILVTTEGDGTNCDSRLIDFGDILYGPALADAAIAGTYLMLNCDNPFERLAEFLQGYQSIRLRMRQTRQALLAR